MGTTLTEDRGLFAALNNCGFVTTARLGANERGVADPFCFLMEASMLGVGVGFDCRGAGSARVVAPRLVEEGCGHRIVVEDCREGWVQSVRVLLEAYVRPLAADCRSQVSSAVEPDFDYSAMRPAGALIEGFGGRSQGAGPLRELHSGLRDVLRCAAGDDEEGGSLITARTIVDIMNLIGRCVVAGNVRRTAEIAFGQLGSSGPDPAGVCARTRALCQ